MPRTSPNDPKGDTRAARTSSRSPHKRAVKDTQELEAFPDTPIEAVVHWADTMLWFAYRHHGWLRLIPDLDGKCVHLKWKFTRGKWPNHYVYVRIETERLLEGLDLLQNKVLAVEAGELRPTEDRHFGSMQEG